MAKEIKRTVISSRYIASLMYVDSSKKQAFFRGYALVHSEMKLETVD